MTESVIRSNQLVKRTLDELPQPKGWPLLGNFRQLKSSKIHQILEKWSLEYDDIFRINLAGKVFVVISDPVMVKDLLRRRPKSINRSKNLEQVFKELGIHGVLSANGESWKRQRKLIMPSFSKKSLISFFPLLEQTTKRLHRRLLQQTQQDHNIAIHDDLRRFTVDITTSLVFGHDTRLLESDGDGLQKHLEVIFPQLNSRTKMPFPYWQYFKLKQDRELDKALVEVKNYAFEIVAQTREELQKKPHLVEAPENILQAMVLASDDDNDRLTNEELFANILTLLLAGEDTTSNLIAWMLYFLSQRPDVQHQINEEVDKVKSLHNGHITVQALDELTYLEAAARETLRLKSTAPMISGETADQLTLTDGTELPAGTGLFLLTRLGGLDETRFINAQQFIPERWLEQAVATEACPHKATTHFPFGGGARHCPGESLAFMEVKMVIAMLCQHFDISPPELEVVVEEEFAITMRPKNLMVCLSPKRNNDAAP
ncbi:cytochrome P450 [Photobacterium sp. SDRW27]|uniref:cytochrome P450 n=1 Tax=Photobacterium obscurum TaxID=2829490 RepID=UPI002244C698|nr:cytochrome P450 [Photobacterium obscurum]MCW8328715.1 cytochrome P450 [Photobacterium obscurum]